MRIVVTGALGHIGSRLIRDLPGAFPGAELVLVDNLSTRRRCSLANLPAAGRYEFFEADVLAADLPALFRGAHHVIHLAAMTDPAESVRNAAAVDRVNLRGTELVARACIATGASLLFVSTTSVYGSARSEVDEDCPIAELRPESPYASSKLAAERLLGALAGDKGLRHVTCRFGTIFGTSPGMRFHTAINKFCLQAATGAPVTVWRTALHQRRPYLDLGDAVAAMVFLLRRASFGGELFNVLTLNTSVSRVVEALSPHAPDMRVEYVDSPVMNQLSYDVDCRRLEGLGFGFKGSLEEGIAETMRMLRATAGAGHTGREIAFP
ncbi:MAG: SDR family oxidoreductase [Proteobacteria bacterium]|nr:SDR family oxidoreductase [Pseudomonadota bacterium]